jgi:hypothetical protein
MRMWERPHCRDSRDTKVPPTLRSRLLLRQAMKVPSPRLTRGNRCRSRADPENVREGRIMQLHRSDRQMWAEHACVCDIKIRVARRESQSSRTIFFGIGSVRMSSLRPPIFISRRRRDSPEAVRNFRRRDSLQRQLRQFARIQTA